MSKIKSFIVGAIEEVRYKVTWPSYSKLQKSSLLVLITSFVFAIIIGLIDLVLKDVITFFWNVF